MKLLIVESSSKCGSIETYLGSNYKCISCNGHIRHIDDMKCIDTKNNFETRYKIDPDKKAHIKKMQAVISQFAKQDIILATDHDREGEAIAWHICEVFDLPPETTSRIVFHEVTKTALKEAIESPRTIDMNMVRAQQARQILDMLVGFSISPLLWTYVNNNSLSAGRCQTPALRLVYENELEAREKESRTQKHKISGCFFPQNLMFELDKDFETPDEVKEFLNLSTTYQHKFIAHAQKLSERSPPKPFNTSAILQAANNLFHMGAKETMACCQTLYQLGHITYMRTENRKYSPIFIETASTYISKQWTAKHVNPNLLDMHGNKDSNNPHEAIRVTNVNMRDLLLIGSEHKHVAKVYKMIWQNTIESCMASAVFNTLPLEIDAPHGYKYKHTLSIPKFKGFLDCAGDSAAAASKTTPELFSSMSMRFQSSRNIQYNYIQSMVGFTNKHSRYTEASLISKLEDLGIGRPSTFSMLVDVIQTRKYVEKKDIEGTKQTCVEFMLTGENEIKEKVCEKVVGAEYKKLVIDPVGTVAIEFLLKSFDSLFSYNYTKELEERLDRVAAGEELWYKVCEDCYREMKQQIKRIGKGDKKTYALADTDEYVLVFCKATTANKNSFVLKDKKAAGVYKTVKSDFKFDMEKLEAGAYTYEELAEIEDRVLGLWNDQEIKLRVGKFGPYLEYGDDKIRVSLKQESIPKPLDKIELKDVLSSLEKESVLRVLTPEISIRKSKYGPYIYYKTEKMKKPKFFDLKKYTDDVMKSESHELVEWITKTHLS